MTHGSAPDATMGLVAEVMTSPGRPARRAGGYRGFCPGCRGLARLRFSLSYMPADFIDLVPESIHEFNLTFHGPLADGLQNHLDVCASSHGAATVFFGRCASCRCRPFGSDLL